jgi:hypothetical protein
MAVLVALVTSAEVTKGSFAMMSGVAIGQHHRQRTLQTASCDHYKAEAGAGVDY